jgi:hypothetical protein
MTKLIVAFRNFANAPKNVTKGKISTKRPLQRALIIAAGTYEGSLKNKDFGKKTAIG